MKTAEVEPVIKMAKENMFLLILKKKQLVSLILSVFFGLVVPFITSKNGETQPSVSFLYFISKLQ